MTTPQHRPGTRARKASPWQRTLRRAAASGGAVGALALGVLLWQGDWPASEPAPPPATSAAPDTATTPDWVDGTAATVAWSQLPPEAHVTYGLIHQGGPFPHEQDGTTFFNRERLLPPQPRGYYREYTVRTPRVPHRGARRIVCGGPEPTTPADCYYTADHYNRFRLIAR